MAGPLTNEISLSESEIKHARGFTFAVIVAQWNFQITEKLRDGALAIFAECRIPLENLNIFFVPGSFELPLAAKWAIEHVKADAIICLGCIIKGETKHDEYLSQSVSQAIMRLNLDSGKPVVFGILTVENLQQANERAGGAHGNKGKEAVITAIKMLYLKNEMNA